MQQVKINVVRLQSLQLGIQKTVHVVPGVNQPGRHLGGQAHLLAVALGQHLADKNFALFAVIGPGSVDIVHAVLNGAAEHGRGLVFIDGSALSIQGREAHAAKAER